MVSTDHLREQEARHYERSDNSAESILETAWWEKRKEKTEERREEKKNQTQPRYRNNLPPDRVTCPHNPLYNFDHRAHHPFLLFFHHTFHTSRTHNQPPGSSIHRLVGHIGVQDRTFGHLWLLDRTGFPPGDLSAMVDASHLLLRHPLLVKLLFCRYLIKC